MRPRIALACNIILVSARGFTHVVSMEPFYISIFVLYTSIFVLYYFYPITPPGTSLEVPWIRNVGTDLWD